VLSLTVVGQTYKHGNNILANNITWPSDMLQVFCSQPNCKMANSSSAPTHPKYTSYYSTACGMSPTLIYMVNNLKVRELEAEPKLDQIQERMAQLETANAAQSTSDRNQKKTTINLKALRASAVNLIKHHPKETTFGLMGILCTKQFYMPQKSIRQ
jgi:hypothetical protein